MAVAKKRRDGFQTRSRSIVTPLITAAAAAITSKKSQEATCAVVSP